MNSPITIHLAKLEQTKPLILCLTNYVTMDFMANCLLAVGAAPLMSCCDDELEELIQMSHAVMLNIGTLNEPFIQRCHKAAAIAKNLNKPIVLDPVGAGASLIRTQTARALMKNATLIRGNASEITALLEDNTKTKGVESSLPTEQAKASAIELARQLTCTVIVSGPADFVSNGQRASNLHVGSPLMPLVTGMGCALTAVIAAFHAVIEDPFEAAVQATAYFGLCGNAAHEETDYPGTFRTLFIDQLYAGNDYAQRS